MEDTLQACPNGVCKGAGGKDDGEDLLGDGSVEKGDDSIVY